MCLLLHRQAVTQNSAQNTDTGMQHAVLVLVCSSQRYACYDSCAVQVTFVAPVRLLLWRPVARTEVHQTVDMSDPSSVKVAFHLLHSVSADPVANCHTEAHR